MLFVLRITKHLLYRAPLMAARVGASVARVCFFVINMFSHSNLVVQSALMKRRKKSHQLTPTEKSCIFFLKSILTNISHWVCRNIFCKFFSRSFFLKPKRKYAVKKPARTQSMKIQVKWGEILVRKNAGKIMQNLGSHRLIPKSARC